MIPFNHNTSLDASNIAIYSPSVVENATVGWCRDFQLTGPPAYLNTQPVANRLSSVFNAQSASEYPWEVDTVENINRVKDSWSCWDNSAHEWRSASGCCLGWYKLRESVHGKLYIRPCPVGDPLKHPQEFWVGRVRDGLVLLTQYIREKGIAWDFGRFFVGGEMRFYYLINVGYLTDIDCAVWFPLYLQRQIGVQWARLGNFKGLVKFGALGVDKGWNSCDVQVVDMSQQHTRNLPIFLLGEQNRIMLGLFQTIWDKLLS